MRRVIFAVGVIVLWGAVVPPAVADKETCKQCKFAKCIKNTIKQKEALAAAYTALANKWDKFWVRGEGENRVPVNSIDLESLDMAARGPTSANLARDYKQFEKDESEMAARIGAPAECGFGDADVEMATDIIACKIDLAQAKQAEQAMPCKELYDIAFRHEALHLEACQKRKGEKIIPPVRLTPAGKAREEAQAYAREIAELKALVKEATSGRLDIDGRMTFSFPAPVGTIVITQNGTLPFTVSPETGEVRGGGAYTIEADTSGSRCRISGYNQEYRNDIGGKLAAETFTFKVTEPSASVIPGFTITCPQGYGFSLPVPRTGAGGEFQMPAQDGHEMVIDVAQLTGGRVKGQSKTTLRWCPKEE